MTLRDYIASGEDWSRRAGPLHGLEAYFTLHAARLHETCRQFDLFSGRLGAVLDIGPFYSYIPFLFAPRSSSYTVLEAPDPATRPLETLYAARSIKLLYADFIELFGPLQSAPHRLPFPDAQFDLILCWETMEHFCFNPVKFTRDLRRLLKPGGRVCITVPNRASFQNVAGLLLGRGERAGIDSYYRFEDYESGGKKVFYGFHWREYTPPELAQLFTQAEFNVLASGSFTAFQDHGALGPGRRLARILCRMATTVLPRYGTHVRLLATR